MPEAVDLLGNKIKEGDIIVYPVRQGSLMWMNKRKVASLIETPTGKIELSVYDPEVANQRATRIKNVNSVTVVTSLIPSAA